MISSNEILDSHGNSNPWITITISPKKPFIEGSDTVFDEVSFIIRLYTALVHTSAAGGHLWLASDQYQPDTAYHQASLQTASVSCTECQCNRGMKPVVKNLQHLERGRRTSVYLTSFTRQREYIHWQSNLNKMIPWYCQTSRCWKLSGKLGQHEVPRDMWSVSIISTIRKL